MTADLLASAPHSLRIDTISDVIRDLGRRFPDEKSFIEAWADSYSRVLGSLAPAELRKVYFAAVDAWRFKRPPRPQEIALHIAKTSSSGRAHIEPWKPPADALRTHPGRRPIVAIKDATLSYYATEVNALKADFGADHVHRFLEERLEYRAAAACHERPRPERLEIPDAEWPLIRALLTPPAEAPAEALPRPDSPSRAAERQASIERVTHLDAEVASQAERAMDEPW